MNILVLTQQGGILRPFGILLGIIMNYIYRFLSMIGIENIGVAIRLFTVIVTLLMIPLTLNQQKFQKVQNMIQPELKKIQKKYEGKKDERSMRMQQAETSALYDKYGASPTAGCLPLLIQLPILFALYRVIYNVPAYVEPVKEVYMKIAQPIADAAGSSDIMQQFITDLSLRVTGFDGSINKIIDALYLVPTTGWDTLTQAFAATPEVGNAIAQYSGDIISLNSFIGGMNLTNAPVNLGAGIAGLIPGAIIPILAAATQVLNTKVMQKNQPAMDKDSSMGSTMNTMNTMMPLMSLFFCATLPTAIGLYWIANAVLRTIIFIGVDKALSGTSEEELIEKNKEKAAKKAEKRNAQNEKMEQYASMNTKNIDNKKKSISELASTSTESKNYNATKKSQRVYEQNKEQAGKKSVSGYAHMVKRHDDN